MKRSKKKLKKLESRVRDWEATVSKNPAYKAAYRKPGSIHGKSA